MHTKVITKRQGQTIHWQYRNSVYHSPIFHNKNKITADPKAVTCTEFVHLNEDNFWQQIKEDTNDHKYH